MSHKTTLEITYIVAALADQLTLIYLKQTITQSLKRRPPHQSKAKENRVKLILLVKSLFSKIISLKQI